MMNRFITEHVKGFGMEMWQYETKDKEVNSFIQEWEGNGDSIDLIFSSMEECNAPKYLDCVPFFDSDKVFLYIEHNYIKYYGYSLAQMREIIRTVFIGALWLAHEENSHNKEITETEFIAKCEKAIPLSDCGHDLDETIEEML